MTMADLLPSVQKALQWLGSQVQQDKVIGEDGSSATPTQVRSETAQTLKALATLPAPLAEGVFSTDAANDHADTETIARRVVAGAAAAKDVSALIQQLAVRQNGDGGWGGDAGFGSSPLDTAWSVLAYAQAGQADATAAVRGRNYLSSQIKGDGSVGELTQGSGQQLYAAALTATALQTGTDLPSSQALARVTQFLLSKQGADGGWASDTLITAWVLQALAPSLSDGGVKTAATAFLESRQNADGSWNGDPYITAVAARALSTRANPVTASGGISGSVADAGSGLPLDGVSITLVPDGGSAQQVAVSDVRGAFSFDKLAAGTYTMSFARAGYDAKTTVVSLQAAQKLSLGQVALQPSATTGIVKGVVVAQGSGTALAGVAVQLGGSATQTATTDSSGRFEFSAVPAGAVTLTASLAGYQSATGSAALVAGQTLVFSPALPKVGDPAPTTGEIFGQVVSSAGAAPLAGASVTLQEAGGNTTTLSTGADGRFTQALPPGSYTASYALAGYTGVQQRFVLTAGARADAGAVALVPVRQFSSVAGHVLDAAGKPIAGAHVSVVAAPAGAANSEVLTSADGSYQLSNVGTTGVTLRASATGFDTQIANLQVGQPTDIVFDFQLQAQVESGLSISSLDLLNASVRAYADVAATAVLSARGTTGVSAVAVYEIHDAAGQTLARGGAVDGQGQALGRIDLAVGEDRSVHLMWNSGQFAPGHYSLVVRLIEPGSQTRSNPVGVVLVERATDFDIGVTERVAGDVRANPPVLRAGTATSVDLSATLQNDGNKPLASETYSLKVKNTKTGVLVYTTTAQAPDLAVNQLSTLNFGSWTPTEGGDYELRVEAVASSRAPVLGKLYVGDSGSASFTVDKSVVGTGNQQVKATIAVRGQDVANGTISDPLAPRVKAAITKAVNYADNFATNHYVNDLRCYACHVQTQAVVGGEHNLKFLQPLNPTQRSTLMSGVTQYVMQDGAIPYQGGSYKTTNTTLGLWATMEWHDRDAAAASKVKMAQALMGRQDANGSWTPDHVSVWWATRSPYAGLNLGSFRRLDDWLASPAHPDVTLPSLVDAGVVGIPAGDMRLVPGADGSLYVAHIGARKVFKLAADGKVTELVSNLSVIGARPLDNGDLLIAARTGVYLRHADGTLQQLSTQDSWDAIAQADGSYLISPWGGRTIYRLSATGTRTPYFDSDLFANSSGTIVPLADGSFVANSHGGNRIVRFNSQGLVNVPAANIDGGPNDIVPLGDGWLVGTESALLYFNKDWVAERWYDGRVVGVAVMPDGRVLVNAGSGIKQVRQLPVDTAALRNSLGTSIGKTTDWLLGTSSNPSQFSSASNIDQAFKLYGLGQARDYYAQDSTRLGAINAEMDKVVQTLRSRQRADGGWVWREGTDGTSDSMVTAMVGIALDTQNPSPDSPEVRKAVELLLNRQQADGTWRSEDGITSVPLLASTWVEIWLPVMLDRLGGIDTDLTVDFAANAQPSGFSITPTSTTSLANGGQRAVWKLSGVTAAGRDLSFNLSLPGLVSNEDRPAATSAFLTFNNTFTGQPVNAPVAVPSVHAATGLALTLATDRAAYPDHQPVAITATLSNFAQISQGGSVALKVLAPDGQVVVDLGSQNAAAVAAGGAVAVQASWNTADWLAAPGYKVVGELRDATGAFVSRAEAAFEITATAAQAVQAHITADKSSYGANDTVSLLDRITNANGNTVIEGLTAQTRIADASGAVIWQIAQPLAQLVGGNFKELSYPTKLNHAVPGRYTATLTVTDAAGQVQASASTAFVVADAAVTGGGLGGTLDVLADSLPAGDTAVIHWSVANQGNAAFTALPVEVRIIDPDGNRELTRLPGASLQLPIAGTANQAQSWLSDITLVDKTLVAQLVAQVGGKSLVLAQDSFKVIKPPIKLDLTQTLLPGTRDARVLVLFDCDPEMGWSTLAAQSASRSNNCYQDRYKFLDGYLGGLGVGHFITNDREVFRRELRSGAYNQLWLLGGLPDCSHGLVNEVREAVNRGTSLLLDGGLTSPGNFDLYALAGVRYGGHLWLSKPVMDVSGADYTPVRLSTPGKPTRMTLQGGTEQASYPVSFCYRVDYDGDDKARSTSSTYPAVVSKAYGLGKAVAVAFDLTTALRQAPAGDAYWARFTGETVKLLQPAEQNRALLPGEYAVFGASVINEGIAARVEAAAVLPAGALFVTATPDATQPAAGSVLWRFNLAADASQALQLALRAPLLDGTSVLSTALGTVSGDQVLPFASFSQPVQTQSALAASKLALTKLQALTVPTTCKAVLLQARSDLSAGLQLFAAARWSDAIEELGEAAMGVSKLSCADLSAERLAIDRLLQEAQYRWYLAQPKK